MLAQIIHTPLRYDMLTAITYRHIKSIFNLIGEHVIGLSIILSFRFYEFLVTHWVIFECVQNTER